MQVYLLNVTENLQKMDEKIDVLFKTFASMIEIAKAELVELVRSTSAQSASTDRSEITKHISIYFGSLNSQIQALFDEVKGGKDREKLVQAATDFATTENLLATVDTHEQRLNILDQFREEVTEKMERSRQRHAAAGASPRHRIIPIDKIRRVTRSQAQ